MTNDSARSATGDCVFVIGVLPLAKPDYVALGRVGLDSVVTAEPMQKHITS